MASRALLNHQRVTNPRFADDLSRTVLGYCLSQHNVELASFMDPNEVLVEE